MLLIEIYGRVFFRDQYENYTVNDKSIHLFMKNQLIPFPPARFDFNKRY